MKMNSIISVDGTPWTKEDEIESGWIYNLSRKWHGRNPVPE